MQVAIQWLAGVVLALGLFVAIRIIQIYREIQHARRSNTSSSGGGLLYKGRHRTEACKTLVVLGSGGHTSEMLHLVRQLDPSCYDPMVYVVAATDHTSVQRLEATILPMPTGANGKQQQQHTIYTIPRSREVGQSFASSWLTTLHALLHSIVLTIRIRPELLLTNGPGTCVPIVLGCWLLRIFFVGRCKFVFCESYCRVDTLSLSGKLLYPIVDCFLVHWESLHGKYPHSYRISTFVQPSSTSKSQ